MNPFLYISLLIITVFSFTGITGCVSGIKTGVIQKSEFAYLKFTGNLDSVSVTVDEGKYNFDLFENNGSSKKNTLYKISNGKHRVQIYRNNNLIIDRMIFVDNHITTEINIP